MENIERRLQAVERRIEEMAEMAPQVQAIYSTLVGTLERPGGWERRLANCEAAIAVAASDILRMKGEIQANTLWRQRVVWLMAGAGLSGAGLLEAIQHFIGG